MTTTKSKTFSIAVGNSRLERIWEKQIFTWDEFVQKIKKPIITKETQQQYLAMSKKAKAVTKDVGGFIGGELKDGKRGNKNIINRCLITLDIDTPQDSFLENIENQSDFTSLVYTTHSHTKDKPRFRWIIPLSFPIDAKRYELVTKGIANQYGIENFDKTTFQADRLMYWPSHSRDDKDFKVYVFSKKNKWFDPLFEVMVIKDTPEVKKALRAAQKKGKDPREKNNIVGAFCRKYSIPLAIEKYLPEVYETTEYQDRYTYIEGSTEGGLIVFDDLYAYSHHSTDPIGGKAVNAFDLVRIHKFVSLDAEVKPNTPIVKYPSFKEMETLALSDKEIEKDYKAKIIEEAFGNDDIDLDEDTDKWLTKLEFGKNKKVLPTLKNIKIIFQNDEQIKDVFYFDTFENKIIFRKKASWRNNSIQYWKDDDMALLRCYIGDKYGITNRNLIEDMFIRTCNFKEFHSVREYLKTLSWDGQERVETLFIDYLGAEDNIYNRMVARKMLAGAVARVMKPGIKFDYILLLVGRQGIGKSLLADKLGGRWYHPSLSRMDNKDAKVEIQGSWIIELAEMGALAGINLEKIKEFVTTREDRFRMPYGKRMSYYKRQCIFWGTTNVNGLLKDRTGNRRFLPVDVGSEPIKHKVWEMNEETRNQIWAEALYIYKNNESLVLEGKVLEMAEDKRVQHTECSSLEGQIIEYLKIPITKDWYQKSIYQRKQYILNYDDEISEQGDIPREKVCVIEVWCELLSGDRKHLDGRMYRKIQIILNNIPGWEKNKSGKGKLKFGRDYGAQTAYIKKKK